MCNLGGHVPGHFHRVSHAVSSHCIIKSLFTTYCNNISRRQVDNSPRLKEGHTYANICSIGLSVPPAPTPALSLRSYYSKHHKAFVTTLSYQHQTNSSATSPPRLCITSQSQYRFPIIYSCHCPAAGSSTCRDLQMPHARAATPTMTAGSQPRKTQNKRQYTVFKSHDDFLSSCQHAQSTEPEQYRIAA